eukprot:scaffold107699_cov23-Tisochrysis_lutea.AAC.1
MDYMLYLHTSAEPVCGYRRPMYMYRPTSSSVHGGSQFHRVPSVGGFIGSGMPRSSSFAGGCSCAFVKFGACVRAYVRAR